MEPFFGRKSELALLDRIYHEENEKTCMIYGRHRIGKTELLRQFSTGKKTLFIQFTESSEKANTEILADEIKELTGTDVGIEGIHQALEKIEDICNDKKTLIVFDDIHHLLKGDKAITSEI
ncbi:MAG: ATP-binding protein, partial [Candidatus Methanomethylophilaceae archaeon]